MKRIVLLITITMLCIGAVAQKKNVEIVKINGFTYSVSSTNYGAYYVELVAAEKNKHIVIPATIPYKGRTLSINSYGYNAFKDTELERVTLPSNIKSIGGFRGCTNLKTITIPNSVTSISPGAFTGSGITEIELPSSITKIGYGAFENCTNLRSITIPNSVKEIGEKAFEGCSNLSTITIPSSVTSIGQFAFSGCTSLSTIDLPVIKEISTGMFANSAIKSIIIPSSVTTIASQAFKNCKNLASISIPNSVTSIEWKAFAGCTALQEVILPEQAIKLPTKENDAIFLGCLHLNTIATQSGNTPKYDISGQIDPEATIFKNFNQKFTPYAKAELKRQISEWQKRGEFESTTEWKARVTTENRERKAKEIVNKLKAEFIKAKTPKQTEWKLALYNIDEEAFPVIAGNDTVYVSVPRAIAPTFKANWTRVKKVAKYDIINDQIALLTCSFLYNGKSYKIKDNAVADNVNTLAINLPPLEMDFGNNTAKNEQKEKIIDRTIDQNIPSSGTVNAKTFAVIIGNENYSMVQKVAYAKSDATVFAEYCRKTLGIPNNNVRTYGDATFAMMMTAMKDIQDIAKAYNGDINVIFYYAGHGIPSQDRGEAYLLPIDADGRQTTYCYPVSRLYQELGEMNVKSVVVLMDACFSGAQRGNGMLISARGVAIKPKADVPQGNMVIMTAANGEETAYPYDEKGHGLFTYFLLKKLRDTKGACTLGELSEYIKTNVTQQSVVINRKLQTPTISTSISVQSNWKTMRLR